jgi:hypothetical protein
MHIHATNINGLGASQVVTSFIDAACNLNLLEKAIVYLPEEGQLASYMPVQGKIFRYKRFLPNSISRLFESFFGNYIFPKEDFTIVLGDVPLRGIKNQIVLVHQANLLYPRINFLSGKTLNFRILRAVFRKNLKYANWIIVQTDIMKEGLLLSYPELNGKVVVIPQPIPNWFKLKDNLIENNKNNKSLVLFYPAAGYKHKNHIFLNKLNAYILDNQIKIPNIEIWLTLTEEEFIPYKGISFVKNLGRLNPEQVMDAYSKCDGLLFLSLAESYGLPLVESLSFSLPILAVDLPYSRWMCEEKAYYFNHNSFDSFLISLEKLNENLRIGIRQDYKDVLSKFPESWESVVSDFFKLNGNSTQEESR